MNDSSGPDGREAPRARGHEQPRWPSRTAGARGRWPKAAVAERLLDGGETDEADPHAADLARLLAVARELPPGRPQDEEAALAVFRRTAATWPAQAPARPARWPATGGPRSVRVLVGGAAAVLALGGVALAAQGGVIPSPFHSPGGSPDRPVTPAPHTRPAPPGPSPTASRPAATPTAAPSSTTPAAARTGRAQPAPEAPATTKGQCEAYLNAERGGYAPEASVRAGLAKAAGGVDRIDAYCAVASSGPASGVPSAAPSPDPASAVPTTPTPHPHPSHTTAPPTAATLASPGRTHRP